LRHRPHAGKRNVRVTTTFGLTTLLLLASSLALPHEDLLGTRYVAADGVDQGHCEHAHEPCASIAYALAQMPDGGLVKVAEGLYSVEGLDEEDLLRGKGGVMGGYSTRDEFKRQDLARYVTHVYGLPSGDRERLLAYGLHLMIDRVALLNRLVAGNPMALPAQRRQVARQPAANCVQGFAAAFPCRNVDLLAHMSLGEFSTNPATMSNLWGFVDLDDNREYAVVGLSNATAVIDVTDPQNPREVGSVRGNANLWREVKVYQFFDAAAGSHRTYAYITTEASRSGLQVIELSGLPNTVSLANTVLDFQTSHTIYISNIDYASNRAIPGRQAFIYIAGSNPNVGAYRIFNLANPVSPQRVTVAPTGAGYMHDSTSLYITDSRTAQCDQGHNPCEVLVDFNVDSVDLWDVTNKSAPVLLSATTYPNNRFTHSGWPTEDQRFIVVHDELDELRIAGLKTHIYTLDIANLRSPGVVTSYIGPNTTTDHNGYAKGNRYYMSHYRRGLVVFDLTDPQALVEVGNLDTFLAPAADVAATEGAWGVYPFLPSGNILVSDIDNGLFILRDNTRNLDARPGQIGFVGGRVIAGESAGNLAIPVRRSNGVLGNVSVDFTTVDGTATAGSDYSATSGTLNWAAGDGADKNIVIPITDDAAQEGGEQFVIQLSNITGAATFDGSAQLPVTVSANDGPAPPGGGGGGGGGGVGLAWLLVALSALGRNLHRRRRAA
jgi:choice-of-anchor B domain-containing protein